MIDEIVNVDLANGDDRTVYVVGRVYSGPDSETQRQWWSIVGVFDSAEKAEAACCDPCDFVGPILFNTELGENGGGWPGAYYPNQEKTND